jgi:hypothetical protein
MQNAKQNALHAEAEALGGHALLCVERQEHELTRIVCSMQCRSEVPAVGAPHAACGQHRGDLGGE